MFWRYFSKKNFKLTTLVLATVLLVLCSASLLMFLLNSHCQTVICLNQAHSQILSVVHNASPVSLYFFLLVIFSLVVFSLLALISFLFRRHQIRRGQYWQRLRYFFGSTKEFNYLSLFLRQGLLSPKIF